MLIDALIYMSDPKYDSDLGIDGEILQGDCRYTLIGSAFLAISVFCQAFRSLVILRMLRWQYGRWRHFSQTQLNYWNSCNCSTEWHKIPQWYSNLFSGLYHLENDGCMGFDRVSTISPESNRCWWTNLSGRDMSILAKTFE